MVDTTGKVILPHSSLHISTHGKMASQEAELLRTPAFNSERAALCSRKDQDASVRALQRENVIRTPPFNYNI